MRRAHPVHFKTCDVVLKACTDAIDGLMAKMELQHDDITEEAKRMREEEEEKHRVQQLKDEEVRTIKKRLMELGHFPPPAPVKEVDVGDNEGEQEAQDEPDSAAEEKQAVHTPVS